MKETLKKLKDKLGEIEDLGGAAALLSWDQTTYMPAKGAAARGRQMALLGRILQEKQIDLEIGRLLDELEKNIDSLPPESDDRALIIVARRNFERAIRIPPEKMAEFIGHTTESYQVWATARPNNDFAAVQPYLEKTLDMSRGLANYFPGYDHIADPLIDFSDFGMKAATIREIFAELRAQLVPLVEAIAQQPAIDQSVLRRHYPKQSQLDYSMEVAKQFGFDLDRGRLDLTLHPFMTKFSLGDVRMTTRVDENNLGDCLFSTLHETGHALYELGIQEDFERTPLNNGTSAGVHESQSRLWENLVGRSRRFWIHQYPRLQEIFSEQLNDVALDDFYRTINKVETSLIRTEADEVTYNLHIMIRFDLELALLEGDLAIKDLPDAWQARYQSDLGQAAPNHIDGVLQDVHWYSGPIGGSFQGYTLGNIMSSLFFDAAVAAQPSIPDDIAKGHYATLHSWLRENLYRHGQKYTAAELVERTTGGPLTIDPYMRYLKKKFGEIYDLDWAVNSA